MLKFIFPALSVTIETPTVRYHHFRDTSMAQLKEIQGIQGNKLRVQPISLRCVISYPDLTRACKGLKCEIFLLPDRGRSGYEIMQCAALGFSNMIVWLLFLRHGSPMVR